MKYFKYIDIPNTKSIQQQLLDIIPKDLHRPSVTFLKKDKPELFKKVHEIIELEEFLKKSNLYEYHVDYTLYVMDGESKFDIHIDYPSAESNCVRILFPILGCDNTFTQFYKATGEPDIEWIYPRSGPPQPYKKFKPSNCEFVTQAELKAPFFIHTQVPHGIYNPNSSRRMSLWINFNGDVDLLQYISEFEDTVI
jgi:hypothetical protein